MGWIERMTRAFRIPVLTKLLALLLPPSSSNRTLLITLYSMVTTQTPVLHSETTNTLTKWTSNSPALAPKLLQVLAQVTVLKLAQVLSWVIKRLVS